VEAMDVEDLVAHAKLASSVIASGPANVHPIVMDINVVTMVVEALVELAKVLIPCVRMDSVLVFQLVPADFVDLTVAQDLVARVGIMKLVLAMVIVFLRVETVSVILQKRIQLIARVIVLSVVTTFVTQANLS